MKVQLTGASGFIGQNLTKLLKFECIRAKISTTEPFKISADIFIHLAGIAHNLDSKITSNQYQTINTELTKKAFDAFLLSNAKIFILLSTVKAVRNESDSIITEESIESPSTDYGRSKLQAEKYILSRDLPKDKLIYILRPALITGPGVKGNMQRLYNFSNKSFNWFLSSINNQRSFCNILNLNFVIEQLIERIDIPSGIYLLSDNETISTGEIVNELSIKGIKYKNLSILSASFIIFLLKFDKFIGYTTILSPLRTLASNYIISNKKITKALGKSLPFSTLEGIRSLKEK